MDKTINILINSSRDTSNRASDCLGRSKTKIRIFNPHSVVAATISQKKTLQAAFVRGIEKSEKSVYYLEIRIAKILREIGIPAHILGYQYLSEAIMLAVYDKEIINYITKKLYPSIAKKFNTTSQCVERVIRHAIEIAWARSDIYSLNRIFGYQVDDQKKLKNGEFIAMLADSLRSELIAQNLF